MKHQDIQLSESNFIASGAYCDCYRHPESAHQCIKIPTDNVKSQKRLNADLAYYKKLHKRKVNMNHIADFIGQCQSNLGKGFIYECITNDNAEVSKTLEHYLENHPLEAATYLETLPALSEYLLENHILISDLHARNILIKISASALPKPMIVDGIGDSVAITILNVFQSQVHSKITRRWNRFINSLIGYYPTQSSILEKSLIA